jgi:hypothetical protein
MTILFTADLHLKNYDRTWQLHPELRGDTAFAIDQIIAYSEEIEPAWFVLAGDAFEGKEQRGWPIDQARRLIDSVCAKSDSLLFVTGQHEQMSLGEPQILTAISDRANHIHHQTFRWCNRDVYCMDYARPTDIEHEISLIPYDTDILITHQVWEEFMGSRGEVAATSIVTRGDLLIITGDYHVCTEKTVRCGERNIRLLSPGSVCMQRTNEPVQKFIGKLNPDLSVEWLPLKTRPWRFVTADVSTKGIAAMKKSKEFEQLLLPDTELPAEVAKPAIVFTHMNPDSPPDNQVLRALCKGKAFPFVKLLSETETEQDRAAVITTGVQLADVPQLLRQAVRDVSPSAAVREDALKLLDCGGPAEVNDALQKWWEGGVA